MGVCSQRFVQTLTFITRLGRQHRHSYADMRSAARTLVDQNWLTKLGRDHEKNQLTQIN